MSTDSYDLHQHQLRIDQSLLQLKRLDVVGRIWEHDHTVWKQDQKEISNRLGWLHSTETMAEALDEIRMFVDAVRGEGFKRAVLLGMGGSSLAPEVLKLTFGIQQGFLDLVVHDSTHPDAVRALEESLNFPETLFIVSTKSGGTVETFSFYKYFYDRALTLVGAQRCPSHFVAITDPGSDLERIATELHFRKVFLNDPNIGGRFSALSFFGLVPAGLLGLDLSLLLERANAMASRCHEDPAQGKNPGALLGTILGILTNAGKEKVTLLLSPALQSFGLWLEQLLAESTGKDGNGILPVDGEPIGDASMYTGDRLFVTVLLEDEAAAFDPRIGFSGSDIPRIRIVLRDRYDLAGEFFRWEFATAVAGYWMHIQPFDQPNVESAKAVARSLVAEFHNSGSVPIPEPTLQADGLTVYAGVEGDSVPELLRRFLLKSNEIERSTGRYPYVAIQSFLAPSPRLDEMIQGIRSILLLRLRMATTAGYGPRYLHSTGQLHKGDAGNGMFLQIVDRPEQVVTIPDEPGQAGSMLSFNVLIRAQAFGDRQALLDGKREVITIDIGTDAAAGFSQLNASLSSALELIPPARR